MSIYQKASLVQIPSGYKAADDKLYSVVPNNGDGDFTIDSDADATRVNKDGLIESVVADQARLNYNFIDGVVQPDPHLLLEPSRSNLITQSETFTTISKANLTVADNTSIVDPQGGTNTKTLTATISGQPRLEWRGTAVPASNSSYAMSFWVRYNTARYVAIAHYSQTGEYAIFDLVDGEVENDVGTQTAKIEAYKNGWYRVSKSFEVPLTALENYWKLTLCTQTAPFTGVSGEKADVFGMQLEAGSYPTSYIPTSGSPATRTEDFCNISSGGASVINSFKNEGTIFLDFEVPTTDPFFQITICNLTSGGNRIILNFISNEIRFQVLQNGSGAVGSVFANTPVSYNQRIKLAGSFKTGAGILYKNGSLADDIDTSFTCDFGETLQSVKFSGAGNTAKFTGKIYQFMYFDTALSQSELATLTS